MSVENRGNDWLGMSGRKYVVTGAGSGIGYAIAETLIDLGARVAMLDRNTAGCEALAARHSGGVAQHLVLACDIGNEASVEQAATTVRESFGPIDGLVNCAGMLRAAPIKTVTLEDWDAVLRTNLTGYMLCSRHFARHMEGEGAMVHIASVAAHHPQTYSGAYSASKAGITLLSRQIAAEYGTEGIRSNVICPGMIRTALSEPFYQQPGIKERREAMTASRRIGAPQDIANAATFLLSPRASYINGAEFSVDGGMESMLMDLIPRPGFTAANSTEPQSA
ncbi:SDR family oxidoreductase [Marinobacterium sp. D7]|uniref:SDR family NAD(P)-dependent oxidoreductase n=1 Tax=Marinobacterium ramblicola TaxID=2849041 RepID=UPI001C2D02F5|nr:SDR family oxidoreductase [Marinobacterium ramblicola]MBV1787595.1 SDR family oxidoreductase [Marinobacterium ramblicola]